MIRRLILLILVLFLTRSYAIDLYSQDINIDSIKRHVTVSEEDANKFKGRTVRVAVVDALSPYDIISYREKTYKGLSADYLYVIKALLALDMEIVLYKTRIEAINAVKAGDVDILATANGYEEHHGLLLSEPYRKDIVGLFTNSRQAKQPKKIGVYHEYLPFSAVKRLFPNSDIVEFKTPKEAILATAYKNVDAVIMDLYSANYHRNSQHINKLFFNKIIDVETKGFSFAVHESFEGFNVVNNIVRELNSINIISSRWYGGGVSMPDYDILKKTRGLVEKISPNTKKLRVGFLKDAAPISYLSDDGEPKGILIELLELFSIYSGVEFEYFFTSDIRKLEQSVLNGDIDFTNLVLSKEREKKLIFSKDVLLSEYTKIVKSGSESKVHGVLYLTRNYYNDSTLKV